MLKINQPNWSSAVWRYLQVCLVRWLFAVLPPAVYPLPPRGQTLADEVQCSRCPAHRAAAVTIPACFEPTINI